MNIASKGMSIDLETAVWRRSSRSGPRPGNSVEVAFVDNAVALRDSTNPGGAVLIFTAAEWDAFVDGAKDGEFELATAGSRRPRTGPP